MVSPPKKLLSVVVPVYNEQAGIEAFHKSLVSELRQLENLSYEVIYVDDGSFDGTNQKLLALSGSSPTVRIIRLSRNFGKEMATTAGIRQARGAATITIDADGQHPPELIPKFVASWHNDSKVVIGVRLANTKEGALKRYGSRIFYKLFNRFTGHKLIPGATDFRLIDATVQTEFNKLSEHNRITRGLIDWMGFERSYINFHARPRTSDQAGYSFKKLTKLAIDSFISLSVSPLYLVAYIGIVVLPLSAVLGLVMVIDALLGDPLNLHTTGSAYVVVLVLFLIGVLLVSQGIIGLYLSHIHAETQGRPLYVIDNDKSVRID